MGNPCLPAIELLQMTGMANIPKYSKESLKPEIRKALRVLDQQNATNRYAWYNLPIGLNGQLIERILYYRGQGILFYLKTANQFFFLPFTPVGSLDVYGRYGKVTPVPFAGGETTNNKGEEKAWIPGLDFNVKYDIILPEELTAEDLSESAVICRDYSNQLSQYVIPRQRLNDPVVDLMSDMPCFMRTALLNSTGVQGMRVSGEDEQSNVRAASDALNRSAINGDKWIPIVGQIDFQELTSGTAGKAEEFMMAMQSLDNLRLSLLGLNQGGVFEKKSHVLQAEEELNAGNIGLVLQDGLHLRQEFCNIVNSIWGLGIWCENSELVSNVDRDMNGEIKDEEEVEVVEDEPDEPTE